MGVTWRCCRVRLQRNPYVDASSVAAVRECAGIRCCREKLQSTEISGIWNNANNRSRNIIHSERLAEDCRVTAKRALPQRIADHYGHRAARTILGFIEVPADEWLDPEHRQKAA